jgi:hypothetical protein
LNGIQDNRSLARLISIDENKLHEINALKKFIDLIDDQRLINIRTEIDD